MILWFSIFLKNIFSMWTIFLKSFIEFVALLLLFYVLEFWPAGMWDVRSQPGMNLHTACTEGAVFTAGPPGSPTSAFWQRWTDGLLCRVGDLSSWEREAGDQDRNGKWGWGSKVCMCDTFWSMTGLLWEIQNRYRKGGRLKIWEMCICQQLILPSMFSSPWLHVVEFACLTYLLPQKTFRASSFVYL